MVYSRVARPLRLALYSHDAQGLGHVRRNLAIAAALADGRRDILLVTGSREAGGFALPVGVELLTLPALGKSAEGVYRPRSLSLPLEALVRLRAGTIRAALASFAPDVLIVDKLPLGVEGELRPTLERLRFSRTRLVLGLREILDDPRTVRSEARRSGSDWAMRELYDAIWVYGDRRVYDPVREYGLDAAIAAKVRFTGYLGHAVRERGEPATGAGPLALCLLGGGEDGFAVASAFARAPLPSGTAATIVTGPCMPAADRRRLAELSANREDVTVLGFVEDLRGLVEQAEHVVCMGGYNTVCEVLPLGRRTLVVPRVRPRVEQLLRAQRLAARDVLDYLHPDDLSPDAIGRWLAAPVRRRPHPAVRVDLSGLQRLPTLLGEVTEREPCASRTREHADAVAV